MKFNKDTKIGEILQVAPEKAEILIECGMHCLGCPASQMETLEEACDVHGIDVKEVLEKLNESAPPTIKFLHATSVEIVENVKRLPQTMALLDGARYIIKIKLNGTSKVEEEMMKTLNEQKWEIIKKTKKGEKLTDIKPLVKEFKYWIKDDELVLNTLIATGSRENLSAELLVNYLKEKISEINTEAFVNIKREEMYILKSNKYIPLYKGI